MPRPTKAEAAAVNWRSARINGPWMTITGILLLWTNYPVDNIFGIVAGALNVAFGVGFFTIALFVFRRTRTSHL